MLVEPYRSNREVKTILLKTILLNKTNKCKEKRYSKKGGSDVRFKSSLQNIDLKKNKNK